jgi:formyl-CoA transferase
VPVPGCPLRLTDSPVGPLQAAPALGQATEEILAELRRRSEAADAGIPSPEREDASHVVYT